MEPPIDEGKNAKDIDSEGELRSWTVPSDTPFIVHTDPEEGASSAD